MFNNNNNSKATTTIIIITRRRRPQQQHHIFGQLIGHDVTVVKQLSTPFTAAQSASGFDDSAGIWSCLREAEAFSTVQYDDTRFAMNELERNRITQAHTNVSNLSFTSDPENALTAMYAPTSKLNMSM